MAREMGLGVLPWSPLAGGILSGKYAASDLAANAQAGQRDLGTRKDIHLATGRLNERSLAIARSVQAVADDLGRTPAQVALAWTLINPAITSTIIGVRTFAQFEDNLAALDISFSVEHIAVLEEASAVAMGFPHDLLESPASRAMFGGVQVEKPQWR